MSNNERNNFEFVLIGAGLANSLLALRLFEQNRSFVVLEKKLTLAADQTWSFHNTDLAKEELDWLRPLISAAWTSYLVRFATYSRNLPLSYSSMTADNFFKHVQTVLGEKLCLGVSIASVHDTHAVLADGREVFGNCVIDGRGMKGPEMGPCGYQKFLGLDLKFANPHGLKAPIIMDTRLSQNDGFHFMYSLPLDEHTLLVEDTYYSDTPDLNLKTCRDEIFNYAKNNWPGEFKATREESAALPIPLSRDFLKLAFQENAGAMVGLRGGHFHATTGYSLPWAVKNAFLISNLSNPTTAKIKTALKVRTQPNYFLLLNRMLFGAALPSERVNIFSRFYQFPAEFISKFYGARMTSFDQVRLLIGKPPVNMARALRSLLTNSWMESFDNVHA